MFHVITGGSGSGKSAYAEDCIVQLHKDRLEQNAGTSNADTWIPLYYVATMMPFGAEMEAKIERHRQMRAGKGFETVECFLDLDLVTEFQPESDILLECMSNLVANEWFDHVQQFAVSASSVEEQVETDRQDCFSRESIESVTDKIWRGVQLLLEHCQNLVIVTNEVFSEGTKDTKEMDCYKQILAAINCRMAAAADQVTEVVYGIPVKIK